MATPVAQVELMTQQRSAAKIAGIVLRVLVALFMLMDAFSHLAKPAPVVDAFARLGLPLATSVPIGILAICIVAIFALPRTAILGAVLLTGYLGGAVAVQFRAGSGAFEMLFPVILGVLAWVGLALSDARVRAL